MLCHLFVYDPILSHKTERIFRNVSHNIMPLTTDDQRPILVTISARAMSSVGFAMSIFAIWLEWLLPTLRPVMPELPARKTTDKSRRRSAPPAPPSSPRRRSARRESAPPAPVRVNSILAEPEKDNNVRHVSFSPTLPRSSDPRRWPIPSERMHAEQGIQSQLQSQSQSQSQSHSETSPWSSFSSSSTLLSTPSHTHNATLHNIDAYDPSVQESDSSRPSSRPSRTLSTHLPKMKHVFANKTRSTGASEPEATSSTVSVSPQLSEEPVKPVRRSSIGFTTPWAISRGRATIDMTSEVASIKPSSSRLPFSKRSSNSRPDSSSSLPSNASASSTSSLSYFTRKSDRRRSTPIPAPRTQPYAHPYYAAPPILPGDPSYSSYLKGLPQFGDETRNTTGSPQNPIVPQETGRSRSRERTDTHVQIQATPDSGRLSVPKRRSASESWAIRTGPQL